MPQFTKAPIPQSSGKAKFKSQQKKPAALRKRPIEGLIYGEELFQSNIKREKEIVIGFYPFTKNNLRISKDGKFVIERLPQPDEIEEANWWNLYYCEPPLADYKPDKVEVPSPEDPNKKILEDPYYDIEGKSCEKFKNFRSLEEVADRALRLVRMEFLTERQKKLEELRAEDAKIKAERDALELALEKEQEENELVENLGNQESSSVSENVAPQQESKLHNEIPAQEESKVSSENVSDAKDRNTTTSRFRKIT